MRITYTGAVAPTRDPVRSTPGRACRMKLGRQKCLRCGGQEPQLEVSAVHLNARRCLTAWRSLRAISKRLDRAVLEPVESAEPCLALSTVHMCEQLGADSHAPPHLCEEDSDE